MYSVGTFCRFCVCLGVAAACLLPQGARAAKPASGFTIEGVADPAEVKETLGLTDAAQLEDRVCRKTFGDALLHLSHYTQGVPFAFDFTVQPAEWKRPPFGTPRMQTLSNVLPRSRSYQVLGTNLTLGRITFAANDTAQLNLAKGLADLPVYVAKGQFPNNLYRNYRPRLWTTVHWLAASDCYQSAILQHLAKTHGNRPVTHVAGRAFPVRVIKASFEKMADPVTPATPTAPSPEPVAPAAAPAPTEAPGSESAPGAAAPAATPPEKSPETPPAVPEIVAPQQKLDAYIYHLEMEVRVEITQVEFGDEAPPTPETPKAPPATEPQPGASGQPGVAPVPAAEPAVTPPATGGNAGTPSGS